MRQGQIQLAVVVTGLLALQGQPVAASVPPPPPPPHTYRPGPELETGAGEWAENPAADTNRPYDEEVDQGETGVMGREQAEDRVWSPVTVYDVLRQSSPEEDTPLSAAGMVFVGPEGDDSSDAEMDEALGGHTLPSPSSESIIPTRPPPPPGPPEEPFPTHQAPQQPWGHESWNQYSHVPPPPPPPPPGQPDYGYATDGDDGYMGAEGHWAWPQPPPPQQVQDQQWYGQQGDWHQQQAPPPGGEWYGGPGAAQDGYGAYPHEGQAADDDSDDEDVANPQHDDSDDEDRAGSSKAPRKRGLFGRLAPGLKKLARKAKKVVLTQAAPYLHPQAHRPQRPSQDYDHPPPSWQQQNPPPQGEEGYYGQPPPPRPPDGGMGQEWAAQPPTPTQDGGVGEPSVDGQSAFAGTYTPPWEQDEHTPHQHPTVEEEDDEEDAYGEQGAWGQEGVYYRRGRSTWHGLNAKPRIPTESEADISLIKRKAPGLMHLVLKDGTRSLWLACKARGGLLVLLRNAVSVLVGGVSPLASVASLTLVLSSVLSPSPSQSLTMGACWLLLVSLLLPSLLSPGPLPSPASPVRQWRHVSEHVQGLAGVWSSLLQLLLACLLLTVPLPSPAPSSPLALLLPGRGTGGPLWPPGLLLQWRSVAVPALLWKDRQLLPPINIPAYTLTPWQMSLLMGVAGLCLMGLGAGLGAKLDTQEEEHSSAQTGVGRGEKDVWKGQGAPLAFEARYRREMREWLDGLGGEEEDEVEGRQGQGLKRRQRRGRGRWKAALLNTVVVTALAACWALVLRTLVLGAAPGQAEKAVEGLLQEVQEGLEVLRTKPPDTYLWLPEGVLVGGVVGVAVQAVVQGRRAIAQLAHAHAGVCRAYEALRTVPEPGGLLGEREGRGERDEEEDGTSGWTTDGPALEEGLRLDNVWVRALPGYQYVVKDVNLHVKQGQILVVCGSEGAGKSVLLKALAGVSKASNSIRGRAAFQGRELCDWDVEAYRRRVCYLPPLELSAAMPCSVADNIMAGAQGLEDGEEGQALRKAGTRAGAQHVLKELDRGYDTVVGVSADEEEEALHDDVELRGLSSGEWRRLQLARALVERNGQPPQLVVLDEPTLLMSDRESTQFMRRLREAQREWGGPVIVIASQQPRLVPYADVVAIMHKGQVLQVGSPQEVLPSPSNSPTRPHPQYPPPPGNSQTQHQQSQQQHEPAARTGKGRC